MPLKNIGNEDLKIGDIVIRAERCCDAGLHDDGCREHDVALVIEVGIDMWGRETIPTGIKMQWPDGETEIVYTDEVFSINDSQ